MAGPSLAPRHLSEAQSKSGRTIRALGNTFTLKVDGADTGGAFAVFDVIVDPGEGSPLHRHTREDEHFYIREGEAEFVVAGKVFCVSAGDYLVGPSGIPHQFRNTGKGPLKLLLVVRPAGLENFFGELGDMCADGSFDLPRFAELASRYGIELLGPPPER